MLCYGFNVGFLTGYFLDRYLYLLDIHNYEPQRSNRLMFLNWFMTIQSLRFRFLITGIDFSKLS